MMKHQILIRLSFRIVMLLSTVSVLQAQDLYSLNRKKLYVNTKVFNGDVLLNPGSLMQTKGSGKLIFNKRVTVIGDYQVFATNVNAVFMPGTLRELNPCWFGARGDDDIDDTEAFLKVIEIAKNYDNSINIRIPLGRFMINQTLEIGNVTPSGKSINLIGESMSVNALYGSSLRWTGPANGVLIRLKNYCTSKIENLDFSTANHLLKHNIELVPFDYQIVFENCSFAGCAGIGSANVNLNKGNNLQVSEVAFENCIFRGYSPDGVIWQTEAGVIGGFANTKDFTFRFCSMVGYTKAAINLELTDMLHIENCTFAHNAVDISCLACNTLAESNYSENSQAFFKTSNSYSVTFTTLMNNCFYGHVNSDYIIPGGSGNLVMINNNFGGMGGSDLLNKIKWDSGIWDHIYSLGNFYRNAPPLKMPFEYTGQQNNPPVLSTGDLIGRTAADMQRIIIVTAPQN